MTRLLLLLLAATAAPFLAACAQSESANRVQLTPEEVRETFIGTPWHGERGAFLFREEGTYTYKDFDSPTPRGTWSYRMLEDGTLESAYTSYTFFRTDNGYVYYHSRSGRYYMAIPNRPPFL